MPNAPLVPDRLSPTFKGRHALVVLLAFFGSVFAVNGYFIFRSIATYTGEVAEEPYRKGLGYNNRIAADDRQAALHWTVDLDVKPTGAILLTLHDQGGQPVGSRRVEFNLGRPATKDFDRKLTLRETSPGVYAGATESLPLGNWIAEADVRPPAGGDKEYRMRRRLWLKP